jgi:hypothetical protein
VEHHDGSFELLRWEDTVASLKRSAVAGRERLSLCPDDELVVSLVNRHLA